MIHGRQIIRTLKLYQRIERTEMEWSRNISARESMKIKRRNAIFKRNTFINQRKSSICIKPSTETNAHLVGQEQWVTLHLKLLDWSFMDELWTVSVDTKISSISNYLQGKHGLFDQLIICRDVFTEETELRHDAVTKLSDCGFPGSPSKENAPSITIYYNFIPRGMTRINENNLDRWSGIVQDPILLS